MDRCTYCAEGKCVNILEDFKSVTDEKIIEQIRLGNSDAFSVLLSRYDAFLKRKISGFTTDKLEFDDYQEEAILSFFTAVNTFDDKKSSFSTYLNVCVTRTLITLSRRFNRHEESKRLAENELRLEDSMIDPQNLLENREQFDTLVNDIKKLLSDLELKALTLYLGGGSYEYIAKKLGTTSKSVDNALQRVRLKLKSRI